ncbi:DNA polymerase, beta domain protein region [Arcticibacter svalbardensis MN12-7]|uniref:DNA polymerase, beta domain protein region n=1 Tax=Arcticibacter svalbardensis MN12-7 TaxID=1150600 RepID=R9GX09_9SPHI|nr:nucleotidyltransferase family protein [Arcticibacter svalbardensis]EOR96357.1 DNA polymerase, beta domain protein region [Arcticibacter svalbardensis MN12-7]
MLTKEFIINKLKKIKPELLNKYPISELALFGSYARGDNHADSDIDILIDFNGSIGMKFFTLYHELEDAFNVKVDLVPRKGIKPHYLPYIEKNLIHV